MRISRISSVSSILMAAANAIAQTNVTSATTQVYGQCFFPVVGASLTASFTPPAGPVSIVATGLSSVGGTQMVRCLLAVGAAPSNTALPQVYCPLVVSPLIVFLQTMQPLPPSSVTFTLPVPPVPLPLPLPIYAQAFVDAFVPTGPCPHGTCYTEVIGTSPGLLITLQ
jgi:hypothetical protein